MDRVIKIIDHKSLKRGVTGKVRKSANRSRVSFNEK